MTTHTTHQQSESSGSELILRKPTALDGIRVNELVACSPPLDTNSIYCNLLQCSHFSNTAIAAELGGELVGFISGYQPPGKTETLFIWQLVVSSKARGRGLAKKMVEGLLNRPSLSHLRYIETTIGPDNDASWGVFRSLAKKWRAVTDEKVMFESQAHFHGKHDDEILFTIGPIERPLGA
jgi:L-2,4-diaminobutyric acid acetyltransferase